MSKTISISKQKGVVIDLKAIHEQLDGILKFVANGQYELTLKKASKPRTLDQNALMWMWFACIEKETGTSSQDIHDYYCKLFLRRKVTVGDREEVVVGGTRTLSTASMTDFLNKVQADAASELGVVLPLPEDMYYSQFIEEYKK